MTPCSSGLSRAVSAELIVARLQQQLREKDLKLTDVQLEALTSAHQLDNLRDAMNRMQVRARASTTTTINGVSENEPICNIYYFLKSI